MRVTLVSSLEVVLLFFLGCSKPTSEYEGQWLEQPRAKWDGATEERYSEYMQEFQAKGPRRFVFEGKILSIQRGGEESRFTIQGQPKPGAETLVLRLEDGGTVRAIVKDRKADQITMLWPTGSKVLTENETRDSKYQIIETRYDVIELVRDPAETR